jgi:hypothetical protein
MPMPFASRLILANVKTMKNSLVYRLIAGIVLILVNAYCASIAFIKLHFNPPRMWRLKGFIQFVAGKISAMAYTAKEWCYAMYSRWRIDSCNLAY